MRAKRARINPSLHHNCFSSRNPRAVCELLVWMCSLCSCNDYPSVITSAAKLTSLELQEVKSSNLYTPYCCVRGERPRQERWGGIGPERPEGTRRDRATLRRQPLDAHWAIWYQVEESTRASRTYTEPEAAPRQGPAFNHMQEVEKKSVSLRVSRQSSPTTEYSDFISEL